MSSWVYTPDVMRSPPNHRLAPLRRNNTFRPSRWKRETRRQFVGGLFVIAVIVWVSFVADTSAGADAYERAGQHTLLGSGGYRVPLFHARAHRDADRHALRRSEPNAGWDRQPLLVSHVRHRDCEIAPAERAAATRPALAARDENHDAIVWFRRFWEPCVACGDEEEIGGYDAPIAAETGGAGVFDRDRDDPLDLDDHRVDHRVDDRDASSPDVSEGVGRWVCDPERFIARPTERSARGGALTSSRLAGPDANPSPGCRVLVVGADIARSPAGFAFEREMVERYGCVVHAYDASPDAEGPPPRDGAGRVPGMRFRAGVKLVARSPDARETFGETFGEASSSSRAHPYRAHRLGAKKSLAGIRTRADSDPESFSSSSSSFSSSSSSSFSSFSSSSSSAMTLSEMLEELAGSDPDALVDVVRVACDGCERDALTTDASVAVLGDRVKQLLLEVRHSPDVDPGDADAEGDWSQPRGGGTGTLWIRLQSDAGMLPFHKEIEVWDAFGGGEAGAASATSTSTGMASAISRWWNGWGGERRPAPLRPRDGPTVEYGLLNRRLVEKVRSEDDVATRWA
jgi:hypothetical protein